MTTIQQKRGTAANIAEVNPTPAAGEIIFETDTGKKKIGDGVTAYNSLPYSNYTVAETDALLTKKENLLTSVNPVNIYNTQVTNTLGYAISGNTMTPYYGYAFNGSGSTLNVDGTVDNASCVDIPIDLLNNNNITIMYEHDYNYTPSFVIGYYNGDDFCPMIAPGVWTTRSSGHFIQKVRDPNSTATTNVVMDTIGTSIEDATDTLLGTKVCCTQLYLNGDILYISQLLKGQKYNSSTYQNYYHWGSVNVSAIKSKLQVVRCGTNTNGGNLNTSNFGRYYTNQVEATKKLFNSEYSRNCRRHFDKYFRGRVTRLS